MSHSHDNESIGVHAMGMGMGFVNSQSTPLWSTSWTPTSPGTYAGTCIFLIVLSIIFRSLFALKHQLEGRWADRAWQRRYVVVADRAPLSERLRHDPDAKMAVLTMNGVEESVKVVHKPVRGVQPWRFSVDLPRAAIVTVIAGIGYLLMLAVMTYNIGYFMSVLGGMFLGELAVGRLGQAMEEHH